MRVTCLLPVHQVAAYLLPVWGRVERWPDLLVLLHPNLRAEEKSVWQDLTWDERVVLIQEVKHDESQT